MKWMVDCTLNIAATVHNVEADTEEQAAKIGREVVTLRKDDYFTERLYEIGGYRVTTSQSDDRLVSDTMVFEEDEPSYPTVVDNPDPDPAGGVTKEG